MKTCCSLRTWSVWSLATSATWRRSASSARSEGSPSPGSTELGRLYFGAADLIQIFLYRYLPRLILLCEKLLHIGGIIASFIITLFRLLHNFELFFWIRIWYDWRLKFSPASKLIFVQVFGDQRKDEYQRRDSLHPVSRIYPREN